MVFLSLIIFVIEASRKTASDTGRLTRSFMPESINFAWNKRERKRTLWQKCNKSTRKRMPLDFSLLSLAFFKISNRSLSGKRNRLSKYFFIPFCFVPVRLLCYQIEDQGHDVSIDTERKGSRQTENRFSFYTVLFCCQ